VDGMGAWRKSLDGLHQVWVANGWAWKGERCSLQIPWGKSNFGHLSQSGKIRV
jgi:hypothetical protein